MAVSYAFLFIIIFVLIILILSIIALVDILRNEFEENNKIIWVLVVIFLPLIGSILYFAMGSSQKIKDKKMF